MTTLILSNGQLLLIEPATSSGLDRRAFRQIANGYEWAHLSDVEQNGARARFYGYAPTELPSSMICGA